MNELQRQQYLDAMGVDTYMPRWVMPHAPAPVACDVSFIPSELNAPANDQRPVTAANQPSVPHTPQPSQTGAGAGAGDRSSSSVLAVLDAAKPAAPVQDPSATPASADDTDTSRSSRAALASQPVPEFALSIWRVSEELLVIDTRQAQLALPTEPLLVNILVALGYPRQPLPRAEVIRWPMVDNPFVGQSEADAREMLEAYLDGKLLSAPAKYLLLMGESAARYVLPSGEDVADSVGKRFTLEQQNIEAIVVPSLTDMLQAPEHKRVTWQAIKPLVISPS